MIRKLVLLAALAGAVLPGAPVPVLFDADFASDCDDVGALALLHALTDLGETQILGMAACTANRWSAAAMDAINTYYGRPDIPIGTIKGKTFERHDSSAYTEHLAKQFPNDLGAAENVPDAVTIYRRILAAQPDGSVVFVAVGWLTNLKNLLESGPDRASPLPGKELVRRKVRMLVDMGPKINPPGKGWNFEQDSQSARILVREWPTRIVFSPKEICWALTGGFLPARTPETNPVRKAYELWFRQHGRGETTRHSADLTAVLYAARGASPYWTEVSGGHLEVGSDGHSEWKPGPAGNQSYLAVKMPFEKLAKLLDELIVRPPRRTQGKP